MDSSVSEKDEIWFLRMCYHISNELYYTGYFLSGFDLWSVQAGPETISFHPQVTAERNVVVGLDRKSAFLNGK
jgi:hypothetical protein